MCDEREQEIRQQLKIHTDDYAIAVRDLRQDRWRLEFVSSDKGEARFALWNYVTRNPGRQVRVFQPDNE